MLRALLLLGAAAWSCAGAQQGVAEPVRVVSSAAPGSPGDLAARRGLELLMRRAGLRHVLSHEPTERAVISLRTGLYDVDLLRYARFDKVVPGAIRVDPHLISTTLVAFSRVPMPGAQDLASLRGLRVAYVRGIKLVEQELGGQPGVEPTTAAPSCLGMVAAGRVDVCLLNAETSAAAAELMDGRRLERRVLVRVDLHLWVAPGRDQLARQLSSALLDLAASGELAQAVDGLRGP